MVPWSIIWVHGIETTHNKKGMCRPVGQTAGDQVRRFQNGCPLPRVAAKAAGMVQRSLAGKLGWLLAGQLRVVGGGF